MAMVTAAVEVDWEPVRRAYVEHVGPVVIGDPKLVLTDGNGSFTFDAGLIDWVDVKIHCHNPAVRVLDGAKFNIGVSFNATVSNGSTINITDQGDHYRILNSCLDIYDKVWRQFKPYSNDGRRGFPLGRRPTLRETFESKSRIELSYPDNFPSPLAFVEPSAHDNDGYPLVHIKHRSSDGRLFGDGDTRDGRPDTSLLPHELGHAFHFAALTRSRRIAIEARYLAALADQLLRNDLNHDIAKPTTPFVAFIEAAGMFSERFFLFKDRVAQDLTGGALRRAFVADELTGSFGLLRSLAWDRTVPGLGWKREAFVERQPLSQTSTLSSEDGPLRHPAAQMQVGQRCAGGTITPLLEGSNVEGAVYGAIYLDFASRVGLRTAVEMVLKSGVDTFEDFHRHVRGRNVADWTSAIDAVARTWKM